MNKGDISNRIADMTNEAETVEDLQKMLHEMAFTIGGMVCHFQKDDRPQIVMGLTQSMGMGLMLTSKNIGEPSNLEVIVGHKAI